MNSKMEVKHNLLFLVSLFITYKASADDKSVLSAFNKLAVNQLLNSPKQSPLSELPITKSKMLNKAPQLGKNVPIGGITGANGLSGLTNTLQLNKDQQNMVKEDKTFISQDNGSKYSKNSGNEGEVQIKPNVEKENVLQLTNNLDVNKLTVASNVPLLTKNAPIGKITGTKELGGLTNELRLKTNLETVGIKDEAPKSQESGLKASKNFGKGVVENLPIVHKIAVNNTNKLNVNKLPVGKKVLILTKNAPISKITGVKGLGGLSNNLPLNKNQETFGTEDQRLKSQDTGLISSKNLRKEGVVKNLPVVENLPINQSIVVNKSPVINKVPELTKNASIGKINGTVGLNGLTDTLQQKKNREYIGTDDQTLKSGESGSDTSETQGLDSVVNKVPVVQNLPVNQLTNKLGVNKVTKNVPIGQITGAKGLGGFINTLQLNKIQENIGTNDQTLKSEESRSDISETQGLDTVVNKVPVVQKLSINQLTNKLGVNKVTKNVSIGQITESKPLGGLKKFEQLRKSGDSIVKDVQIVKPQRTGFHQIVSYKERKKEKNHILSNGQISGKTPETDSTNETTTELQKEVNFKNNPQNKKSETSIKESDSEITTEIPKIDTIPLVTIVMKTVPSPTPVNQLENVLSTVLNANLGSVSLAKIVRALLKLPLLNELLDKKRPLDIVNLTPV